jgi:hypothetical protein
VDHGINPALDAVERHWREQWRAVQKSKDKSSGNGAVIIVGRRDQDKFFSNGGDLILQSCKYPNYCPFSFILIGLDLSFVPFNGNFFRCASIAMERNCSFIENVQ